MNAVIRAAVRRTFSGEIDARCVGRRLGRDRDRLDRGGHAAALIGLDGRMVDDDKIDRLRIVAECHAGGIVSRVAMKIGVKRLGIERDAVGSLRHAGRHRRREFESHHERGRDQ